METLHAYLATYSQYHTHPTNKLTHYIAIPIIIISLLMALTWIHISIADLFTIDFSWLLLIGVLIFYYRLNIKLALLCTLLFIPCVYLINLLTPFPPGQFSAYLCGILFVGGWIIQLIGHLFEGKKPAFMDSFSQLFIAPLFFILEILNKMGLKKYFLSD